VLVLSPTVPTTTGTGDPISTPLSRNWTVPGGSLARDGTPVSVAVNVTLWPRMTGFGVAVTTTVVLSMLVIVACWPATSGSSVSTGEKLLPETVPWFETVVYCGVPGLYGFSVTRYLIVTDLPAGSVKPGPAQVTGSGSASTQTACTLPSVLLRVPASAGSPSVAAGRLKAGLKTSCE
jgi:hypothetical protein